MKKRVLITAILALGAFAAHAQTTFTNLNADISVTNSWDNGFPTLGNQGTIAMDATRVADVDISGWDIVVANGGTIDDQITSYLRGETSGGSILEVQTGGTYTRTSGTWRWHGGATMKVTGGDVDVSGLVGMGTTPGGFTLDMTGGTFDSIKLFNYNNGAEPSIINVSGGTAVIGVVDGAGRIIDEANTFHNISGTGSLTINNLDYATAANDTNIVVTISDAGQFVTHIFDNVAIVAQADRYIDFTTTDVTASWTWTGKAEADFISAFNAGSLRHNGESGLTAASFEDHFVVVGDAVFVAPPVSSTTFTGGAADGGLWATSANWSDGVPDAAKTANIDSNLTANLSGGAGSAQVLIVGGIAGQSGGVTNGSLTVVNKTDIGTGVGSSGAVDVTTYNAGTDADDMKVGAADSASGSLVSGSGTVAGDSLVVGAGEGANGALDMGTGSLSFDNASTIGSGTSATGTVDAATFNLSGTVDLTIGSGVDAYGRVTAGSGTVAVDALSIASGKDSTGTLDLGTGTATVNGQVSIGQGRGSVATLALGSAIVLDSTNGFYVGTGFGSSNNVTAADFSISGPIGDLGVGEGTHSTIKTLINANDSIGAFWINTDFTLTGGTHDITALNIANQDDATAAFSVSGATATFSGIIDIASGANTSYALDLADLVSGDHIAGAIDVGRGDNSVGSLTYTNGNLETTGTLEVGTDGDGSNAEMLLSSLSGGQTLSICNAGTAATGTVTVAGDAAMGTVRVGRGLNSVATLNVGGTLTSGTYLNSAGLDSNAVGRITATTLDKTVANGSIQVAQGHVSDGSIIASNGTISANGLAVSTGNNTLGLFAVTNGMATLQYVEIASGDDSDGTVLVGITSSETNNISIGTGSNSVGRLTLPAGTLVGADLLLGSGTDAEGTIDLTGGNLVVGGAITAGAGATSFINVADGASTFTWTGKVEADFEALWAAGTLRRDGASGLTGDTFSDYFQVTGDLLEAKNLLPVGDIVIAGPIAGGDMTISWVSAAGQSYDVVYKNNLVYDPSWTVYTNVTGTGAGMTVTVPATDAETFYQVTSE